MTIHKNCFHVANHKCLISTTCLTDSVCHSENDCHSLSCGTGQAPYCNNGGCNCRGLVFLSLKMTFKK